MLGFAIEFKGLVTWEFELGTSLSEVILFPRGAPRGGSPGGVPGGVPGSCSGFPSGEKNLRIRPQGYFFMLRSILILPDLEIPLKSQTIMKKQIYKNSFFFF